MKHRAVALAAMVALLTMAAPAVSLSAPRRVAVVVGNDDGGPSRGKLRYARRDARRMSDLLRTLGGVQQVSLLQGSSADRLRQVLARLARRPAQHGTDLVLFFYFSGHADHTALLMGRTRFPFEELKRTLRQLRARAVVAIIDACQSGEITRAKGGRVVPVVDVRFEDQAHRGRVFITSSAAGEKSQESDRLQASFFTHYLISGLRGAADDSADGRVSLQEAYRFAYRHTLARTATSRHGPQHPSYRIDLAGAGQIILTHLSPHRSYLVLPGAARGTFFIHQKSRGSILAEVTKVHARPLRIALPAGRYEVSKRLRDHRLVGVVQLSASRETVLQEARMDRRPLLPAAGAKGAGFDRGLLRVYYMLGSGYLLQAGLLHGAGLGYSVHIGPIHLGLLVSYQRSSYHRADGIFVDLDEASAMLSVEWRFVRWPWLHPMGALDIGGSWVWQQGELPDGRYHRLSRPLFRYRGRLGLEVPLFRGIMLGAWGHLGQVVLEKTDGWEAPLAGGMEAGLIIEL